MMKRGDRAGFTLMELLVVLAVIGVVMGILFPVLRGARERARMGRARTEVLVLHQAWLAYWNTYGTLPEGFDAMDQAAVDELGGGNERGIIFMEFDNRARDQGMRDPWGHLYGLSFGTESVSTDPFVFETRVNLMYAR